MTEQAENFDIDSEFKGEISPVNITGQHRLAFARSILICIGLFTTAFCAAWAFSPDNKALSQIFDFIKIGVLPLITLIIGFYFPNASK